MRHLTTATMTTFALALGFQTGHAAPPHDVPSMVVHFADLDLSRTEGARVLYQRLRGAAETVCAQLVDRDLAIQLRHARCVRAAIRNAVKKVDQPMLTAYYNARTNRANAIIQVAQK